MTKLATHDLIGLPTAFYSDDVHGSRTRPVWSRDDVRNVLLDEDGISIIGAYGEGIGWRARAAGRRRNYC